VESIHGEVYFVDTDHRKMLHLAAVFICNFTNHMLTMGKEVALKAGFSFDLLAPLLKETISKAIDSGPENSQTGPAETRSEYYRKAFGIIIFLPRVTEDL
jgi:predicted short-subunit dehydrogenase-like oxidoreductase (DUF2520 family)